MGTLIYKLLLLVTVIIGAYAIENNFNILKRGELENLNNVKPVETFNFIQSILNLLVQPACKFLGYESTPDPCIDKPCKYGGKCGSIKKGTDYFCYNCPYPMGGKDCSRLACGKECFRYNDTIFFVYQTECTWEAAYQSCDRRNMMLAVMNDKETHAKIIEYFTKRYDGKPDVQEGFWIGLHRELPGDSFTWADGQPLESYDGWVAPPGNWDICVNIANGATFNFKWKDDSCVGGDGWKYFPLCQKKYSFLA